VAPDPLAPASQHDEPVPDTPTGRRWPIALVRILAIVMLLQVFAQAALAGGFITGNVDLLGLHSANAILLALASMVLTGTTILLVRPGRGPWWPIPFSVLLFTLIVLQTGFGYARQVGLHIPMGVAIMGLTAAFTWWSCAYRAPAKALAGAPETTRVGV
jgi:hypothetical protein